MFFRATLGDSFFLGSRSSIKVMDLVTEKADFHTSADESSAYT